jgi:hypothetical protein
MGSCEEEWISVKRLKLIEKLTEKMEKVVGKDLPMKAPLTCSKCGKPLYHTLRLCEARDQIIDGLLNSPYLDDQEIGREIVDQCIYCICEHPKLKPHLPRGVAGMVKLARRFLR